MNGGNPIAPHARSLRRHITEAGRTCHRCGDLAGWSDVTCPGCNELLVKGKPSRRGGAASTGATPSMTTRDGAVTPLTRRAPSGDDVGRARVAPVDGTLTNGEARMTAFGSSWLVQRLEKPRNWRGTPFVDNPFSFGGGIKNGGMSDEAMGLIRGIWSFDYMGASEFEWGAVPKALTRIAQSSLAAFSFAVPLSEVRANWRDKTKAEPVGDATIYVLCPEEWRREVEARIREFATDQYRLKEHTGLAAALRPVEDYDREKCGWLELDNGFLFFIDAEMWGKACALFGVKSEAIAA